MRQNRPYPQGSSTIPSRDKRQLAKRAWRKESVSSGLGAGILSKRSVSRKKAVVASDELGLVLSKLKSSICGSYNGFIVPCKLRPWTPWDQPLLPVLGCRTRLSLSCDQDRGNDTGGWLASCRKTLAATTIHSNASAAKHGEVVSSSLIS